MNIYDMRVIRCSKCDKCIGEVECDAEIILPKCGKCTNPIPTIPDIADSTIRSNREIHVMQ